MQYDCRIGCVMHIACTVPSLIKFPWPPVVDHCHRTLSTKPLILTRSFKGIKTNRSLNIVLVFTHVTWEVPLNVRNAIIIQGGRNELVFPCITTLFFPVLTCIHKCNFSLLTKVFIKKLCTIKFWLFYRLPFFSPLQKQSIPNIFDEKKIRTLMHLSLETSLTLRQQFKYQIVLEQKFRKVAKQIPKYLSFLIFFHRLVCVHFSVFF